MKHFILVFIAVIILFISACNNNEINKTKEEIFNELQKTIDEMETYKCKVKMKVYGNKSEKSYLLEHIFKKPNLFYIKMLKPEESNGCLTIYNGENMWLYHPQIEESYILKKSFNDTYTDKCLFIGYFLRNFLNSNDKLIEEEVINNIKYLVLTKKDNSKSEYRKKEKLWMKVQDFKPYKLVIFNENNEPSLEVEYFNFDYNVKIEKEIFQMQNNQ